MSKRQKMSLEGALFCIENPLLDISAEVDDALLQKYGLESNSAILAEEKHLPLYKELVDNYKVQYIAGGAAQNTARVAQWMCPESGAVAYAGCVGKDENGKKLREVATQAGVRVEYLEDEKVPTGVCAVLITGKDRSMVTNLLAANEYKQEHLERPEVWAVVEKARCIYVGGYFLTVSPPSAQKLAKHAAEQNKIFCMNLSAPFISMFFKEPLMATAPYWDVLFGNETEAATFAKEQGFGTEDLKEIALKISELPKENSKRPRIVVITHGSSPTLVATEGKVTEHPIIPVESSKIVDTNSAGDAFAGGFLSQLIQDKSIDECVRGGHYAASIVIQHPGCSYPEQKPDF